MKFAALIRDAWLILGMSIIYFVLIESVLSFGFYYRDAANDYRRVKADTYQNADWTKKYYDELYESGNCRWSSYVYWRRKPYQGQYINIDDEGNRKTWNPETMQQNKNVCRRIFMFGGSTVWGTGARDDFTIPSIIAKQLAANGINARVTNFGESGYVSTQEMILLIRELQKGNIPDLAIFYDGTNDTYSAYQQHSAGLPESESNRVSEFNTSNVFSASNVCLSVVRNLSTTRLINGLLKRFGVSKLGPVDDEYALANDVLDIYEKNVEIIQSLAERYSFKVLFYWQPVIYGKKHLTKYEEGAKQEGSKEQPFFDVTYELLRRRNSTNNYDKRFHDISMIFSDVREPIFIDRLHLGETGNSYIAERITTDILSIMGAEPAAEKSH